MSLLPKYKVGDLTDAVVYCEGTDDETEYPIKGANNGWTLREIVKKAISILEVDSKDRNNEEIYEAYCRKLDSKVKGGQAYGSNISVSAKSTVTSVMYSIREMIPVENKSLECKFQETVEKALKGVDLSVSNGLIVASDKQAVKIDEFIVMQVLQTGYCIDIIPTFIEFYGIAEGKRVLFSSSSEVSANINYRQTRYTLNRGHIQSIIKKLDDDNSF